MSIYEVFVWIVFIEVNNLKERKYLNVVYS